MVRCASCWQGRLLQLKDDRDHDVGCRCGLLLLGNCALNVFQEVDGSLNKGVIFIQYGDHDEGIVEVSNFMSCGIELLGFISAGTGSWGSARGSWVWLLYGVDERS